MAACEFSIKRGASFDLLVRLPSRFADGQFAGWVPTSQVRSDSGGLVAALDVEWTDVAVTRVLRLRKLDTSAWPVGQLWFDICLESPDGVRVYTDSARFDVIRGMTEHG